MIYDKMNVLFIGKSESKISNTQTIERKLPLFLSLKPWHVMRSPDPSLTWRNPRSRREWASRRGWFTVTSLKWSRKRREMRTGRGFMRCGSMLRNFYANGKSRDQDSLRSPTFITECCGEGTQSGETSQSQRKEWDNSSRNVPSTRSVQTQHSVK